MMISLEQFLNLCKDDNDVYVYDVDGDYLDCGCGCHAKYLSCKVLSIWLAEITPVCSRICVQIDW